MDVLGGAENVRIPRLPLENPPPTRAWASAVTKTIAVATAINVVNQWKRDIAPFSPAKFHPKDRCALERCKGRSLGRVQGGGGLSHRVAHLCRIDHASVMVFVALSATKAGLK